MLLTIKYIVLELLSPFTSTSTTRTASKAQKTSEFILIVFHVPIESYGVCHFSYLPRQIIKLFSWQLSKQPCSGSKKCQMKADTKLWKSTVTKFKEQLKLMLRPCVLPNKKSHPANTFPNSNSAEHSCRFTLKWNLQPFFFFVITRYSVQLISLPWIPEGEFSIFHNEKGNQNSIRCLTSPR